MKVCLISSSGGHLEQLNQLQMIRKKYDTFLVTTDTKAARHITEKKYLIRDLSRKDTNIFKYSKDFVVSAMEGIKILIKENPDLVITTGAGAVIPFCIFAKVMRKKLIYIESFARIETPNATGKLLYHIADKFIVQWEPLLEYFPKAIYGGWIY